jgi:hypothetical protein
MPRTLMPTPEDPHPVAASSPADAQLDPEAEAVLDFLHEELAPRGTSRTLEPPVSERDDRAPTRHDRLVYLPAASHCYAIIQYDPASARLVRRVVGLFSDVGCAEAYARDGGYHLYDVVPATAVIPKLL